MRVYLGYILLILGGLASVFSAYIAIYYHVRFLNCYGSGCHELNFGVAMGAMICVQALWATSFGVFLLRSKLHRSIKWSIYGVALFVTLGFAVLLFVAWSENA